MRGSRGDNAALIRLIRNSRFFNNGGAENVNLLLPSPAPEPSALDAARQSSDVLQTEPDTGDQRSGQVRSRGRSGRTNGQRNSQRNGQQARSCISSPLPTPPPFTPT